MIAKITCNLDLLLDLLHELQNVDRQDTLGLDGLAIGTIGSRVDDDLSLLHRGCHHHARLLLLDTSGHVNLSHTVRLVLHGSVVHVHLLLHGILVVLGVLATGIVVPLMRVALVRGRTALRIAVNNSRLTEYGHVETTWLHNARLVHRRGSSVLVMGRDHVLRHACVLLLLHLMGALALTASVHATLATALVDRLAQLVHAVSVCAIVRIWTGLSNIEVLAHDGLVVLELLAVRAIARTRILVVTSTAVTTLIASAAAAAATTSTTSAALEAVFTAALITVAVVHLAAHLTATTTLRIHAAATSTAHLIVVSLAAACTTATAIRVVAGATTVATAALVSTAGVVGVTATTAVATAAALVASTMAHVALVSSLVGSTHVLMTAGVAARTSHSSSLARGCTTTGLSAHILRDWIVHLSQFGIAVSVLTILTPLAEALVLEVSALLSLVALIDLAEFAATATRL